MSNLWLVVNHVQITMQQRNVSFVAAKLDPTHFSKPNRAVRSFFLQGTGSPTKQRNQRLAKYSMGQLRCVTNDDSNTIACYKDS